MGCLELCLICNVLCTHKWNYSFGSWTCQAKAGADNLSGDIDIGICISSENHEFEERYGEIHEDEHRSLGSFDI